MHASKSSNIVHLVTGEAEIDFLFGGVLDEGSPHGRFLLQVGFLDGVEMAHGGSSFVRFHLIQSLRDQIQTSLP